MSLNDKQLEERKFLVTASNLPVICGLSPYSTPWELWAKKTGLVERSPSTLQQDLGSAFQEPIQRVANKHMDLHIIPNSLDVLVHHPSIPWAAATPDGHIEGDNVINEVKLVGVGKDWRDGVPPYVMSQIQWQMACCQADACIVLALVWSRLKRYDVQYSQEMFDLMLPHAEEFHRCLVENEAPPGEPPPPVEMPTQKSRQIIEADIEDLDAIGDFNLYAMCDQKVKNYTEKKKECSDSIKHRIGEYGGIRCGRYLATWYADKNGKRRFNFKEEEL